MRDTIRGLLIVGGVLFVAGCGDSGDDCGCGDDRDTDTATDTQGTDEGFEVALPMVDCDGGKLDEETGLCWENPPSAGFNDWFSAKGYCDDLELGGHTDWRLPDVEELITLLRGCQDGFITEDLSRSICAMLPTDCTSADNCIGFNSGDPCVERLGPGQVGCYTDPSLSGNCGALWSSTSYLTDDMYYWGVEILSGVIFYSDRLAPAGARCVRDEL